MGPKHSREAILAAAVEAALDEGLSQLTFGRLAKRLGINDRTIVYYFPSKDDLLSAVLLEMGVSLQAALAEAFTASVSGHEEAVAVAWPVLARPDVDPVFALFFEANGLAATGREPFRSIVSAVVHAWVAWLADRIDGPPGHRRAEAEAAIALIDGLLLLRQLSGPAAANRAATALGVRAGR